MRHDHGVDVEVLRHDPIARTLAHGIADHARSQRAAEQDAGVLQPMHTGAIEANAGARLCQDPCVTQL